MKEPKDLGVKMGTKEEASWKNVLKQAEELVVKGNTDLRINIMIVNLANKEIELEKAKFKQ